MSATSKMPRLGSLNHRSLTALLPMASLACGGDVARPSTSPGGRVGLSSPSRPRIPSGSQATYRESPSAGAPRQPSLDLVLMPGCRGTVQDRKACPFLVEAGRFPNPTARVSESSTLRNAVPALPSEPADSSHMQMPVSGQRREEFRGKNYFWQTSWRGRGTPCFSNRPTANGFIFLPGNS